MKNKVALLAAALVAACSTAPPQVDLNPANAPEAASGQLAKPGWATRHFAVATANPLAAAAGHGIIKSGGSAVDAAIAVQMVLALVEPQSSGIGGGALLLHFDGRQVEAYDGRETAPAQADEKLFIGADGKPLPFNEAVVNERSVGVPGAVRMLEMAHRQHGKLPWARLFEPAIELAERGFAVTPRLATLLKGDPHLRKDPIAAGYFFEADGSAKKAGTVLRNPALAHVLRRIAAEGSRALHEGEIARAIVDKLRSSPSDAASPSRMTMADLAGYQARKREPLCHDYAARGKEYRICGFPPPSSGAIAIGQILGILAKTGVDAMPLENGLPSADWLHLYTEASRLAFADRAQYVGDPDFVRPPAGRWTSLLDPAYLAQRARLIGDRSMKVATAGSPASETSRYSPAAHQPEYGTSHISIVDAQGRAVEVTTTIEAQFGSRRMVTTTGSPGGFLLNNELTDFSFLPADAHGVPVANRVQPGKRPRSSMSPTFVFEKDSGRLVMGVGSSGGAAIIHHAAKTVYGVLNWGLDVQRAVDLPNFASMNGPSLLEAGRFPQATIAALRTRGAEVRELPMTSGLHSVQRTPGGYFGGADPRREGIVMGD